MSNIYQDTFKIFIKAKNLDDIINGFYSLIKNPIAFINKDYQLVSYCSPFLFEDAAWESSLKMGYISTKLYNKIREQLKFEDNYKIITNLSSNRRLVINLKYNDEVIGLLIILEAETKLEEITEDFINIISNLVIKYASDQYIFRKGLDTSNFFLSLIDNKLSEKEIYVAKVKDLKLDLSLEYFLFALDFNNRFNNQTKLKVEKFLFDIFKGDILTLSYKDGSLIMVFKNKINSENKEKINNFLFENHFYAITSPKITDLFYLSEVYKDEIKIFNLIKNSINYYQLFEISDFTSILPLVTLKREELINFVDDTIYQVFHYDQLNKTNLLDTIYIYLLTERSLAETAKRLYLHKNTITYRLEKVKELFNLDFNSFNKNLDYINSILIIYYLKRTINKVLI